MYNSSKRIGDVERIFEAGNIEIKVKADLAKVVEEPCLAACEDLYDKNILTYWSSSNKNSPNTSFILIRYESLDYNNKAIADRMLKESRATENTTYDSQANNSGDNYGKGICISIPSNLDMLVSDVSNQLKKLASTFEHQDILYNVYTPQDLIKEYNSRTQGTEKSYKFPHIESIAPFIMSRKTQADDSVSFDTKKVAQTLDWIYDKKSGNMYKDEETIRRHKAYIASKEDKQSKKNNLDATALIRKYKENGNF
ncbi:MAG: hypothetical protein PHE89_02120 [Alphaproteobacteria bacterium]|nr:hypothetical protein [Alphaproteobacteria bacterium]